MNSINDNEGYWTTSRNACEIFGVTGNTIRRWTDSNKITYKRTPSNQRVYFISTTINQSKNTKIETKQNVIYCRVSSSKQKDDLERQCLYLSSKYPDYKIIKDIGSGLNYKRPGLLKLLEMSNKQKLNEVVISSKDRLCRFGFELIEW
jgi:predicted site-specific integrase-resolvase